MPRLPVALSFLALAACGGSHVYVPSTLANADPSSVGTLVGSIGIRRGGAEVSGGEFRAVSFALKPVGAKDSAGVSFTVPEIGLEKPAQFKDKAVMANTFQLRLPEGSYEITHVSYTKSFHPESYCYSKVDLSVPIKVERGKTLYIGEYLAHGEWGKNVFGMSIVDCGYFVVTDKRTRDLPAMGLTKAAVPLALPTVPPGTVSAHFFRVRGSAARS
jgi:hypothetical protein